jgi:cytochrome c5
LARRPDQTGLARGQAFAYPFGAIDSGAEHVVADCGYNSGRGVSGVDDRRTFAETIPPVDAYATRAPPNPKQNTTLATIESYVTAAEQDGGGWVQLVFHHLCNQCDAYSISPADFTALLDWLEPRAASGTAVQTTSQVIGGPALPPCNRRAAESLRAEATHLRSGARTRRLSNSQGRGFLATNGTGRQTPFEPSVTSASVGL